jgi:pimeloyl-ACP methyl ester carboxylesterase
MVTPRVFSERLAAPVCAALAVVAQEAQTVLLRDGRRIGCAEYGRDDGTPGFYFHGHPGCRLEPELAEGAAAEAGVRIIALDRPGYGLSDFQPGRTLLDWPRDVAEVADLLGLERFAVLGSSGGGPYALACAHELPERVTKVGVVSGIGPRDTPGATEGMRWQNRIGFDLGARFPALARLAMSSMERKVRRRPEQVLDAIGRAMSPSDAAIVARPEVRRVLTAVFAEAFSQGSRGAAADIVLLGRPWGFRPEDINPPVLLWQGEEDVLVPPPMGRDLAARIPHCDATFLPGEGHLLIVDHLAEIVRAFS